MAIRGGVLKQALSSAAVLKMPPKHRDQLLGELRSLQDHAAQLYREEGLVDDDIDIDIHIDPPPVLPLSSEDYALSQGGTEQEGGWASTTGGESRLSESGIIAWPGWKPSTSGACSRV